MEEEQEKNKKKTTKQREREQNASGRARAFSLSLPLRRARLASHEDRACRDALGDAAVIYRATDRIVAWLSLGFCELYYEVGKATWKNDRKNKGARERERERERDGIPLPRLFDPKALPVSLCRASILRPTFWPTSRPHTSPLSEVFKSTTFRGTRAHGNRYPFATDRNIRSAL